MIESISLENLIDIERLQRIQDEFTSFTGISAGICDEKGRPVTQPTAVCDFCKFTKVTVQGSERCRNCDRQGGEEAMRTGKSSVYTCHAGLIDFAAPISVEGKMIGCFLGGHVRSGDLDEERIRNTAKDIGVNPEMYLTMAKNAREMNQENLQKAMDFMYEVTNLISDMAYKQYQLNRAKEEVEKAARMKSDFLANMSHEIRTPMNAVIGMAELALREELSPAARDYINQIKVSGKTLLTIINDILDFSKIEAGKLQIVEDTYEPLSLINDISNVILTRIGSKPVELCVDVPVDIPCSIKGDSIRIKQVLMNLANNAVKFTDHGQVLIRMNYDWVDGDNIQLNFDVVDTGIGISEDNLKMLFQSFQQVDSKRNRMVEGTGLGLAISKQLTELMHGSIHVESEYGKGSTFSFSVPQRIVRKEPAIRVDERTIRTVGLIDNGYTEEQLQCDIEKFGGRYLSLSSMEQMTIEKAQKTEYIFIQNDMSDDQIEEIAKKYHKQTVVVIADYNRQMSFKQENIVLMRKPIYAFSLSNLFDKKALEHQQESREDENFAFIAPDARILIVDDNAVNLTVAAGLLKPLQMQIDTAFGGKDALDKLSRLKYDLIFMDHMMPELDGVETTQIIRNSYPEYKNVPIIALTANVVAGTREMFLHEGMNDFVAKPIDTKTIIGKLHYWLPQEKQIRIEDEASDENDGQAEQTHIEIEGLDTEYALRLLGTKELFFSVLRDYYGAIQKKTDVIRRAYSEEDWKLYTIEVHALKSASRQIGAMELYEIAAQLEAAGNRMDIGKIRQDTPELLDKYEHYSEILAPFCEEKKQEVRQTGSSRFVMEQLEKLRPALDELDMDAMEEIANQLNQYEYEDGLQTQIDSLCRRIEELDVDQCEQVIQEIEQQIQQ